MGVLAVNVLILTILTSKHSMKYVPRSIRVATRVVFFNMEDCRGGIGPMCDQEALAINAYEGIVFVHFGLVALRVSPHTRMWTVLMIFYTYNASRISYTAC
ncbi:uncharacterized protein F4807DRAFT_367837 [Annulohypoxylon truncatum]|uniref:uncharacterized protein n=1 Tax=Annulohypoxylon truncatum TaxID=327061 RepID=UPI002007B941|nr:uncharacterized protein F4807DRAFT_367837 [Annulohypoxylon truncatum]KAI1212356.1 hypothetical protein F4807DRAFT_367837 [Annulohypoxylon truncatum]